MKANLKGKIVVITGGDGGIGFATCKRLFDEGAKIFNISKSGKQDKIFEKSFQCDISNDEMLEKVVNEIVAEVGKIDFLLCNAGFGIGGKVENASIKNIDAILNVNLIAHVKLTRLLVPHINEGGKIVYTGSLASIIPLPYQACYSASKAGIESFSRAIATELRDRKIKTTVVMPGDIKTGFTDARIKESDGSESEKRGIEKMEKAERSGKDPDSVAKVFLKVLKRKNPPLRVSVGGGSKMIAFLTRIVPTKLLNFLVRKIYV